MNKATNKMQVVPIDEKGVSFFLSAHPQDEDDDEMD